MFVSLFASRQAFRCPSYQSYHLCLSVCLSIFTCVCQSARFQASFSLPQLPELLCLSVCLFKYFSHVFVSLFASRPAFRCPSYQSYPLSVGLFNYFHMCLSVCSLPGQPFVAPVTRVTLCLSVCLSIFTCVCQSARFQASFSFAPVTRVTLSVCLSV